PLFGPVASDPTVSRIIGDLAADVDVAIAGIAAARAGARATATARLMPDGHLPLVDGHVIVDIDATLITCHSEKELAAPTFKRGFGFHPMLAFADHGGGGTGSPLAVLLRPGNAGSNTASDHIWVLDAAVAQLDPQQRTQVLVRTDAAGGTKTFLQDLTQRKLAYSVGFAGFLPHLKAAIDTIADIAWTPAINTDHDPRDGAWVAEITDALDLTQWPAGMRVIARKERPHPGAQLTLTDIDGHRVTCFATNDTSNDLPALEARHRQRARCEDRIRDAKDTGADRLPFHDAASNAIWLHIVLLAMDLITWSQQLALTGTWRKARPKTLRMKLYATATPPPPAATSSTSTPPGHGPPPCATRYND
ncbi:MAG: IS1380 family transposase, partial [Actinomycetales bacterium]